ncbi:alpha/beta hydrolase [Flavisolibacter ginsenosidimutans]|nr:alpha/beta fold hydrolase [Flavisolibacter ginsenosidimutans]
MKLLFAPFILLAFLPFVKREGLAFSPNENHKRINADPVVIDEPLLIHGLEIRDFNKKRCIQLKEGTSNGVAEINFFEPSACYDLTLFYVDEKSGKAELAVLINGKQAGSIPFDEESKNDFNAFAFKKKTIAGINIQQWSKISLLFTGDKTERCRIEKLVLTPVGAFKGQLQNLKRPETLQLFETADEKQTARGFLPHFVNDRIDSLMKGRVRELQQLKTPQEWLAQQNKTRQILDSFFGKFPAKTALHPVITGKIEREKYTIEKLYFESRPHYYVTANFYLPKERKLPVPGVLFTCGHSDNGKNNLLYHSTCLGLVLKGYAVLVFDPVGQGERVEYFNANTKTENVDGAVDQHYYLGRPSFLVNRTLSGLRAWDATRALDYLTSRPEVDTSKIAAVGNSGGGQMALLITALDHRIKVCAAGHPGGQMEKNYLPGQNLIDRQIFSLIAPRPVRIIVGEKSGEEAPHRKKIEDIQLFMEGLGYNKDRAEIKMVDGVHDIKLPKREAVYEWLNRWFGKENEGTTEATLHPEEEENLWVTKSGLTLVSLGGESGQSLNEKELEKIYKPVKNDNELKQRIAARIGLNGNEKRSSINAHSVETIHCGDLSVEKLTYQSEEGMLIPALLIKPKKINSSAPVYVYASEQGKPRSYTETSIPFALAQKGNIVLAIDVRGVGETSPTASLPLPVKYSACTAPQWIHDCLAIQSPGFGRTMTGMRTFDVMRGIDFIQSRNELKDRKIFVYGEGIGGLWALLASIYDSRVAGVITNGTLTSYKQLVANKYYAVSSDYFWLPGVLCDFDIPALARLATKQQWIDPINGLGEKLTAADAATIIGNNKKIAIVSTKKHTSAIVPSFQP